jgi:ParB family chromosome partitioning protein
MVPSPKDDSPNVLDFQERRLGRTVLRTYRTTVDVDQVEPNERQPRDDVRQDADFQVDIESNEGLAEPLLVEPHPQHERKFRIIDGGRRWANTRELVRRGREQFRIVPVEVTDRTLTDDERLRVWVHIQRRQREWEAKEKEMVANALVEQVGVAGAASILELTVREIEKLVATYKLAKRFTPAKDGAGIVWARELLGISKKLLTPSVVDAVVQKVNQRRITNSKDIRKLRQILPDPVARQNFLTDGGDLESALLRLPYQDKGQREYDFSTQVSEFRAALRKLPFSEISRLKGNLEFIDAIGEVERALRSLRETLEH